MPSAQTHNLRNSYRLDLQQLADWDDYLRRESRLPSPCANLGCLAQRLNWATAPVSITC